MDGAKHKLGGTAWPHNYVPACRHCCGHQCHGLGP